jgi:glycosyltransferase involved in cell wall biosynthesis
MKVAVISTWRVKCGVARYTEELCNELGKLVELKIFAEKVHQQPAEDPPIDPLAATSYVRCWKRREPYDELIKELSAYKPDVIHFQFQSAMYDESLNKPQTPFLELLNQLHGDFPVIYMTFHDVLAREVGEFDWYRRALDVVKPITTNDLAKRELMKWAPCSPATVPLGSTLFEPPPKTAARAKLNLSATDFLIVQPGFYGADKGMTELVRSMPPLLKTVPNCKLVFAGTLHPLAPAIHKNYMRDCIRLAYRLDLINNVVFLGEFISEEELNLWLGAADIVVLNHTQIFPFIGASAIAKRVLCAGKPLIFNAQDPRLSEFKHMRNCLKINGFDFGKAVTLLRENKGLAERLAGEARKYAEDTSFREIARRHLEIYQGSKI